MLSHNFMSGATFVAPVALRHAPPNRTLPQRTCPACTQSSDDEEKPPPITSSWREFRAAMIAGSRQKHENEKATAYRTGHWAHPLSLPETGCFLASHPAFYRRKIPYLTQSVVFLTHYDPASGATGLVLNRPLQGTAQELEASGLFGRSLNISKTEFKDQPVYIGGPNTLQKGVLSVIHSDMKVGGIQPLDGVYLCDLAQYLSLNSAKETSDARLFFGCTRWEPGALEDEVDEGSWYCVGASEQFVLKHCLSLPVPLWKEIMICQGGVFKQIANRIFKSDESDDKKGPDTINTSNKQ